MTTVVDRPERRPGLVVVLRALGAGLLGGALVVAVLGALAVASGVAGSPTGGSASAPGDVTSGDVSLLAVAAVYGALIGAGVAALTSLVWLMAASLTRTPRQAQLVAGLAASAIVLLLAGAVGWDLRSGAWAVIVSAVLAGLAAFVSAPRLGYERSSSTAST